MIYICFGLCWNLRFSVIELWCFEGFFGFLCFRGFVFWRLYMCTQWGCGFCTVGEAEYVFFSLDSLCFLLLLRSLVLGNHATTAPTHPDCRASPAPSPPLGWVPNLHFSFFLVALPLPLPWVGWLVAVCCELFSLWSAVCWLRFFFG